MPTGDAIQNCCPAGHTCNYVSKYSATCTPVVGPNTSALQVCTPGPRYAPDDPAVNPKKLPSCIIIGDSVSIGYTPYVVKALEDVCFLQHSPWAGGGGAADTKNGLNCVEEFLRTSDYKPQTWDLIFFNYGLHNLNNSTAAEAEYKQELAQIADRINHAGNKTKVLYGLTTPMMVDFRAGNKAVEDNNVMATAIMNERQIPIIDLYTPVIKHCGAEYVDCDICAASPCNYHYKPAGYQMLSDVIAAAIKAALQA
jgi:hypothetical protein